MGIYNSAVVWHHKVSRDVVGVAAVVASPPASSPLYSLTTTSLYDRTGQIGREDDHFVHSPPCRSRSQRCARSVVLISLTSEAIEILRDFPREAQEGT